MKRIISVLLLLVIFSFSACNVNKEDHSSSEEPLSTVLSNETPNTSLSFDVPESDSKPVIPSYGCSWTLPNGADDENPVVFDGTPIKLTCSYENVGTGDFEMGIRVFIAGVLQSYCVEETPDEEYELFSFSLPEGEKKEYHILVTPNVGSAGDELEMQLVDVTYPNYVVRTNDPAEGYDGVFSGFATINIRVLFNADAPTKEAVCTDFSGVKVSDVDPLIRMFWEYMSGSETTGASNTYENIYFYLYTSSVAEVLDADDIVITHSDFLLKADKDQQFIINLCGKPGKYRVAFFVNHQALPVFDGYSYADVQVLDGQQTELIFHIDTTELNEFNHCYFTVYRVNDTFDAENEIMRAPTEKLNIIF